MKKIKTQQNKNITKAEVPDQSGIAIVGMSCWYPGASSLNEFWENILARRQQFRRMPDERLPLDQYHDPLASTPDKTYGTEAAVLDGFEFDWKGRRIPKKVVESTDIVHWLALEVALKALDDSGLDLAKLQKLETGVILGNTLTGEWTRTNAMRTRWPYVARVLEETALQKGLQGAELNGYIEAVESAYKSVFPEVTEDTLAGALSNTIAGRICNFLDLHGGGYTVDGACSSSLLAIITAARNLASKDIDVAFAGGIDVSLDTFELIGFAKTGAITPNEMRVYDKRGNGFIPGEGCGFVVMKRLEDALKDGDRIYAVLKGWGVSSDGKGGMTAPSVSGQTAAIRKAYAMAGYSLSDCQFVEGHGTGTALGDKVEISALVEALGGQEPAEKIGLTSLKSIVGHTKAAAGVGAFIKAAVALNQRVLPPMAGVEDPHALFADAARSFFPIMQGSSWSPDTRLRAGVSAMGFGGINTHVTLESYGEPAAHLKPSREESVLLSSHDRAEILVFSAHSQVQLQKKIDQALGYVRLISRAELGDLAADLSRFVQAHEAYRASVVAQKPEDAYQALLKLKSLLEKPMVSGEAIDQLEANFTLSFGHSSKAPRLAFVFPGQGSQKIDMGRKLVQRYAAAAERANEAESIAGDLAGLSLRNAIFSHPDLPLELQTAQLAQTEVAQAAISLTNVLWLETLERFGLRPSRVAGHSLGELSALYAAKAIDFPTLIKLALLRGRCMAHKAESPGAMIHMACDADTALKMMAKVSGYMTIANRNAPDQTVISGEPEALAALIELAKGKGMRVGLLPVSNAFHSEMMQNAAAQFGLALKDFALRSPRLPFVSGIDGALLPESQDLASYLSEQILRPVDFIALSQTLRKDVDLVIEVGPSAILSGLMKRIPSSAGGPVCLPTESQAQGDQDFKVVLGASFARGANPRWDELYRNRFHRPFVRPQEKQYIVSPTEKALSWGSSLHAPSTPSTKPSQLVSKHVNPEAPPSREVPALPVAAPALVQVPSRSAEVEQTIFRTIHEMTGFEIASLSSEMRVLNDLNMDSIKASELLANVTIHYGVAGELEGFDYTNASLGEIADAIRSKLPASSEGKGAETLPLTLATKALPQAASIVPEPLAVSKPSLVRPQSTQSIAESSRSKNLQPWVRNFTEVLKPASLSEEAAKSWQGRRVEIAAAQSDGHWQKALAAEWEAQGAQLSEGSFGQAEISLILVPQPSGDAHLDLETCMALFHQLGQTPWKKGQTLVFLQADDGAFGTRADSQAFVSAKAFAQSLAHERPDLIVRCLSIPAAALELTPWTLQMIAAEIAQKGALQVAAYDTDLVRHKPQLELDERTSYESQPLNFAREDVVIVSGGAKGITAACAQALAEMCGTRMALLGSSAYSESDAMDEQHPIRQTLLAYEKAGLSARYFRCDIKSEADVVRAVAEIRSSWGKPRALLHGAGVNQARPLSMVSAADARREVEVKVKGMSYLLKALAGDELKLVMGLTSVIGVLGMPGNAWYGFANEALDLLIRRYAALHPACRTQTFAYSVWSELGMGARMGSDKNLENKGISSIVPEEGISRFLSLIQARSRDQQTIICSRLGAIGAQAPQAGSTVPGFSFIDQVLHFQPEVECIARTHLNLQTHPYLLDHNYKGAYLMPTVHGLEAMSQVVGSLVDLKEVGTLALENIQLARPITVGSQGCDIEIYAIVLEAAQAGAPRRIRAGIRTALSGFKVDHFSADFVLADLDLSVTIGGGDEAPLLTLDAQTQLYGPILFQGPLFQRLRGFHHLESDNETEGQTTFVAEAMAPDLSGHVLGDPYFRDSLLQSAQIIIPQNQCLPVEIERIELHRGFRHAVKRICTTEVKKADGKTYLANITVCDEQGRVLEKMSNYRLQFLEKRLHLPKAMDLIAPQTLPSSPISALDAPVSSEDLLAPYRAIAERLLIDAEAHGPQDQSVFVHRFIPDFKTFSNISRSIYFSHFFNWMGSAREMSSLPVLDKIRALTETGRWGLVTNWASIEVLGECRNKDRVVEARMWCGKISGSKNSSATLTFDWVSKGENGIEERIATGQMGFTWVEILDHGIVRPAEFPDYYKDFITSMIAKNDQRDSFIPAPEPYRQLEKGENLFRVSEGPNTAVPITKKVFETSLFDANLVGNLYFGNYSIWMGKLRDSYLYSLAPELFRGIGERGEFTCVKSRIQHLREAMPFDSILVTLSLKAVYEQAVDLQFEFYKLGSDGHKEKLATAEHQAIWTRQDKNGAKYSCQIPDEIRLSLLDHVDLHAIGSVA